MTGPRNRRRLLPRAAGLTAAAVALHLAILSAVATGWILQPSAWDAFFWLGSGASAACFVWAAILCRRLAPALFRAWFLLAVGQVCFALGDMVWGYVAAVLKQDPYPSLADAFYLLFFVGTTAGLVLLPGPRLSRGERWRIALDMSIAALAMLLVFWIVLISPTLRTVGSDVLSLVVTALYAAADLVLVFFLTLILMKYVGGMAHRPLVFLAAGGLLRVFMDMILGYRDLQGAPTGNIEDVGWTLSYGLMAMAGLAQVEAVRAGAPPPTTPPARYGEAVWTALVPYAWGGAAFVALATLGRDSGPREWTWLAAGVGAVLALAVVRHYLVSIENRRLFVGAGKEIEQRERAEAALRLSNDRLEQRVAERTAELAAANLALRGEIGERRRMEEERLRLEAQVQRAQKFESLGLMAGGIAHDFNNILMAILGHADLALSDLPPSAPARASLDEIGRAARRASELCRQMLAYSGRGRIVFEAVRLNELVEETVRLLEVSIVRNAVLRLDLAADLPVVNGDATQLRQVVMNLVLNASEALGERGGAIEVSSGAMVCDRAALRDAVLGGSQAEGPYVYVEVRDTGVGMDAAILKRIFDPFFTTKFTGRGLGLAAVLGIVQAHRGAITVQSEPGRGTCFRVLIPVAAAASGAAAGPRAPLPWTASGTVLLVDGDESVLALGQRMLERLGFHVLTARDGPAAVEAVEAHGGRLACVQMDLATPRGDGAESFRRIRAAYPRLPIILCSGRDEGDLSAGFPGCRPDAFVRKPYRLATLADAFRRVLERER